MKIKNFTSVEKAHFKKSAGEYLEFYKEVTSKLSPYSHAMYSRALSYIAVENGLYNLSPNKKPSKSNPIVFRRNKLLRGINKQIQNIRNIIEKSKKEKFCLRKGWMCRAETE